MDCKKISHKVLISELLQLEIKSCEEKCGTYIGVASQQHTHIFIIYLTQRVGLPIRGHRSINEGVLTTIKAIREVIESPTSLQGGYFKLPKREILIL